MSEPDLQGAKILLVDDQPANLDILSDLLESQGYNVHLAPSGTIALKSAVRVVPDLILLDVMMPEMDGFEACRRLKEDDATKHIPVIFITARDLEEDVVTGFRTGGVDYITKPFKEEEVLVRVETQVRVNRLAQELVEKNEALAEKNLELEAEIAQRKVLKGQLKRETERWGLDGFIGESQAVKAIFEQVELMQDNPTTSVLITGESGTGKELIARAIHFGGPREEAPFVPVNCNAIPGELVESALFGHVRGAFTGANEDRAGHFEMADKGTLFLDEIGDMPVDLQGRLLRVIEDGEVWPVGASAGKQVDVRVLAATNADLQEKMDAGTFRQDLYFRLARYTVTAPALRNRKEDIPLLAKHFLRLFSTEMGREAPVLSAKAVEQLAGYDFPGNVRELKNIIERAMIESRGGEIEPDHLHFLGGKSGADVNASSDLPMDLDAAEREANRRVVAQAMEKCGGNISEAARLLGTTRNRIYRIMNHKDTAATEGTEDTEG